MDASRKKKKTRPPKKSSIRGLMIARYRTILSIERFRAKHTHRNLTDEQVLGRSSPFFISSFFIFIFLFMQLTFPSFGTRPPNGRVEMYRMSSAVKRHEIFV
ncbi:hypothetical protein CEXT_568781 [Caerostris extrusa]|uniref:Transmembrane protein n=1 Tax=Caerostris extrusa TaxID=172846 RepID=A0AAV4NYP1_CAEEX|nr:hypothetical protein CEXT_568781 [Caerostris extrusa]